MIVEQAQSQAAIDGVPVLWTIIVFSPILSTHHPCASFRFLSLAEIFLESLSIKGEGLLERLNTTVSLCTYYHNGDTRS